MTVACPHCLRVFDDAEASTICPHKLLMPREDMERKKAALQILGKFVRFAHQTEGPYFRVQSVNHVGMVTVEEMDGWFAPHLFVEKGDAPEIR